MLACLWRHIRKISLNICSTYWATAKKYIYSKPQQYNVVCTDRQMSVCMGNIDSDQIYLLWQTESTDRNKRRACYPLYLHCSYFLYWTNAQSPIALIPHNAFPISLLSRKCTTESVLPHPTTVRTVRLSVSEATLWEVLFENYSTGETVSPSVKLVVEKHPSGRVLTLQQDCWYEIALPSDNVQKSSNFKLGFAHSLALLF